MYVKLSHGDLNIGPCLPHLMSTYTCGVTIAPKACGGEKGIKLMMPIMCKYNELPKKEVI